MLTRFSATQTIEIFVEREPIPIAHYLRQPQRLVNALVDPSRMEQLSAERFRLKMRPLDFMHLQIQPTVDMRVWAKPDGTVYLTSVGCEIRGVDYINQRFSLDLMGKLVPYTENGRMVLRGKADLAVEVDVPSPLDLTPLPMMEMAGNSLLKSVLLTIKQRLKYKLLQDYRQWIADRGDEIADPTRGIVPKEQAV